MIKTSLVNSAHPPGSPPQDQSNFLFRVYIPELEPAPAPKSFCDPVLVAYKEIPADKGVTSPNKIKEGDVVRVRYGDPSNLAEPKIIEIVETGMTWNIAPDNNTSRTRRNSGRTATTVVAPPPSPTTPVTEPPTDTSPQPPPSSMTAAFIGVPRPTTHGAPQLGPPGGPGWDYAIDPRPYGSPIQEGMLTFPSPPADWNGLDVQIFSEGASNIPILTIADGTIVYAPQLASPTHGYYIIIEYADVINGGNMYVRYANLVEARQVSEMNQEVAKGDIVGYAYSSATWADSSFLFNIYKHSNRGEGTLRDPMSPIGYYPIGSFVGGSAHTAGKSYVFEDMIDPVTGELRTTSP